MPVSLLGATGREEKCMIIFSVPTLKERFFRLWPPYAKQQDIQLEAALIRIVKSSDKCIFDCDFTPESRESSSGIKSFK